MHTFGDPLQLVVPVASKASSVPPVVPTKTTLFATAGDDEIVPDAPMAPAGSIDADHSGWQVSGLPTQFVVPVALKA